MNYLSTRNALKLKYCMLLQYETIALWHGSQAQYSTWLCLMLYYSLAHTLVLFFPYYTYSGTLTNTLCIKSNKSIPCQLIILILESSEKTCFFTVYFIIKSIYLLFEALSFLIPRLSCKYFSYTMRCMNNQRF